MLGLRYVNFATSALLLPWVMRARISDSRSLSPSPRPGQSSPPTLRVAAGHRVHPGSPASARRPTRVPAASSISSRVLRAAARWRSSQGESSRYRPPRGVRADSPLDGRLTCSDRLGNRVVKDNVDGSRLDLESFGDEHHSRVSARTGWPQPRPSPGRTVATVIGRLGGEGMP